MARAQYDSFRPKAFYWLLAVSLLLLAAALFVPGMSQALKILCIMLGSFTLVGLNSPARQLADQVIRNLNGHFPCISYAFEDEIVRLKGTDSADSLSYSEILLLLEQKEYLYLFLKDHSAYMIERKSIMPDEKSFMEFLTQKTGLPWSRNSSVLNTSLRTLIAHSRQSGSSQ